MTMLDITLQIFRYKPGQQPHYDTFTVQVEDTAHVIDAIDAVWARHDHTLTFRRACHHSSCGSCALRINGVEKLPCITRFSEVWDGHSPLRLDPLRNFPIVSDLVVDVSGFYQRLSAASMSITRDAEPLLPLSVDDLSDFVQPKTVELPENLSGLNRFENCIECGICMSACPTMAVDDKFLGPAGLAAIYSACQQTDDQDKIAHLLALADGEHGVWRCHSAFECTEACPQAVDPAGKIMALRREITANRFKKGEEKITMAMLEQPLEKPKYRRAGRWFDVRGRKLGMWAYTLNRITGIGLVVYLYLHLGILSLLSRGSTAWDSFVSLARSPYFLTLDVILLAGALIHGLNGLRIAFTGLDVGVKQQKVLFGVIILVAVVALGVAALKIFGGEIMDNSIEQKMMNNPFAKEPKASSSWHWQVFTGIALVFLLDLHLVANHFVVKGGLRDFADVVAYLRNPIVLVLEILFMIVVTIHAMLGVRAIVTDFGLSDQAERHLSQALTVIGVLTVIYALWLTWTIIR